MLPTPKLSALSAMILCLSGIAVAQESKPPTQDPGTARASITLVDVWYRTEEPQVLIAYKETGTLEVTADRLLFTYSGGQVEIPVSAVQRITPRKRFTFFDQNTWVVVEYRVGDKDLVGAFKPALLGKVSHDDILKAISSAVPNK
jgi:hypothetical protein